MYTDGGMRCREILYIPICKYSIYSPRKLTMNMQLFNTIITWTNFYWNWWLSNPLIL